MGPALTRDIGAARLLKPDDTLRPPLYKMVGGAAAVFERRPVWCWNLIADLLMTQILSPYGAPRRSVIHLYRLVWFLSTKSTAHLRRTANGSSASEWRHPDVAG